MTKESVVKGLIEIVSNAQMVGSFHDAYNNDKCYYHKGHNCYIVQTIKINEQFGCGNSTYHCCKHRGKNQPSEHY